METSSAVACDEGNAVVDIIDETSSVTSVDLGGEIASLAEPVKAEVAFVEEERAQAFTSTIENAVGETANEEITEINVEVAASEKMTAPEETANVVEAMEAEMGASVTEVSGEDTQSVAAKEETCEDMATSEAVEQVEVAAATQPTGKH